MEWIAASPWASSPPLRRELGVAATPQGLRLDDGAPLAPIRIAITEKPPAG